MADKKKTSKAQQRVTQVLNQAKESLKLLGTFEKEAIEKARSFVKIPSAAERRRLTNDKILSGLRKLGVATQSEVNELSEKVHSLETALKAKNTQNAESHSSIKLKSVSAESDRS